MGSSHGKSLETEKGILCKTSMKDILVIPEVNKEEKLLSRKFVEHGHFLYEDQTGLSLKLEITKTVYSCIAYNDMLMSALYFPGYFHPTSLITCS
ncbi:PREDICTED: uncharacterized protein LOC109149617 isoform X5 [Ipomoea nil]|uniref:uncharacterized protein LOC109149617 isoform X5 n=1 Tax=Ipomoea nil TaxID=35883 RepID=UPI00090172EF|nr:PREDICTED: uncharacterized protein LOC109149617 isoform X5 [Ipomoea nil]